MIRGKSTMGSTAMGGCSPAARIFPVVVLAIVAIWSVGCSRSTGGDARSQVAVLPDSLDFGETETSLSLRIDNPGEDLVSWSIWAPAKEWISLDQTRGALTRGSAEIEVRIDREKAPAGRQWVALAVGIDGERREISLSAFISRAVPVVRPERLDFGDDLKRMSLFLKNTGNLPLVWRVEEGFSWLAVERREGRIEPNISSQIDIAVEREGLVPGIYGGQLVLGYDGNAQSIRIPVKMTVRPNSAPQADAGLAQRVGVGGWMQLDGTASRDADGDPLSFRWTVPPEIELDDATAVRPRFHATTAGSYRIGLVVDDGRVESVPAEVSVEVVERVVPPEITVDLEGEEFHLSGVSIDMVWIEPGRFTMGAPAREEGHGYDEDPQHEVVISQGFYLGKYEITQEQWRAVMGNSPWAGKEMVREDPHSPAVFISWHDVQKFVRRLNEWAGEELYRLPTEAEWEYACRAMTTTRWSFGEDESHLGDYAWYRTNAWDLGDRYAHPVGMRAPNGWNLHDMHGNVWEWVQDWFSAYSAELQTDPTGPSTGSYRAVRGGSFSSFASGVRSAERIRYSPGVRVNADIGARLARTR